MTPFPALLTGLDGGSAGTAVSARFFDGQLLVDAPAPPLILRNWSSAWAASTGRNCS
jgi:hypothetical protein